MADWSSFQGSPAHACPVSSMVRSFRLVRLYGLSQPFAACPGVEY